MAMRYCKDCQLYECCMRTPLGGCQEFDNVRPELKPPITTEDALRHLHEQVDWDWEKFRREAAKDFMTAIIAREAPQYDFACRNVSIRVSEAIMWADELIKQLKDEKNR